MGAQAARPKGIPTYLLRPRAYVLELLVRGGRYARLYRLQMSTETENALISANRDRAVPTEGTEYNTNV